MALLSIFGKDIADNIFVMVTFADGQRPPVMNAITEAKIPFNKFFKFNNSAIFADKSHDKNDTDDEEEDEKYFDKMFWDTGEKSFKKFFTAFEKTESKSLQMTREVWKERKQLEVTIVGLQPRMNTGLSKLEQLHQEEKILNLHQADIEVSKEFQYSFRQTKHRKVDLEKGTYITTCMQCHCI